MKSHVPRRGSTLLAALAIISILALIVFGVLSYTGAEQERGGRSVRDLDAQSCVESAAQYGRKFYGDNYMYGGKDGWEFFLAEGSQFSNPEEMDRSKWAKESYGRIDGKEVKDGFPADFRVTIRDNADEFDSKTLLPAKPEPYDDKDMQVILRAECLIPELALRSSDVVESPRSADKDPSGWHGRVLSESSETRRNKVIEMIITFVPDGCYAGQAGSGCRGDRNVSY